MSGLVQALAVLLPVLYLIVTALYAMEFGGPRAPRPRRLRVSLTVLVAAAHGFYVGLLWSRLGHMPASEPWLLPSLLTLAILVIYMAVERISRSPQTGAFVLAICFLLQLLSSMFAAREPRVSETLATSFFALHVGLGILALAALLLSGFFGGLYLVLLRQMQRRTFGVLFRNLPDLDSLSRLNRGAATMGFLLLTIVLNTGLAWAHADESTHVDYLDPKILVVMATWAFFGLIAASRWIKMLSGRRAAVFAVAGLTLVFLTLVLASVPLGSLEIFR